MENKFHRYAIATFTTYPQKGKEKIYRDNSGAKIKNKLRTQPERKENAKQERIAGRIYAKACEKFLRQVTHFGNPTAIFISSLKSNRGRARKR